MVGMDMGVYDVVDGDARLFRFLDEPFFIARDYVYRYCLAFAAAAEKIGK
jgi:hypothetical protein